MSPFNTGFTSGWQQGRAFEHIERERLAELHKPPAGNPPAVLAPTPCRVLKPFYVRGRAVEVGEVVELQRHDALSLQALRKVELL